MFSPDSYMLHELVPQLGTPSKRTGIGWVINANSGETLEKEYLEYVWPCGCTAGSTGSLYDSDLEGVSLRACPAHQSLDPSRCYGLSTVADLAGFTAENRSEIKITDEEARELLLAMLWLYPAVVTLERFYRDGPLMDALKAGDLAAAKAAVEAMAP